MQKKELDKTSVTESDSQKTAAKDRAVINQLKGYKKNYESRWFLATAFYEGVHFTRPKKDANGNWDKITMGKNKTTREIPKAKKQLKSVRNLLLKRQSRPVVYPDVNVIIADNQGDKDVIKKETDAALLQARYVDYYMNEKMKLSRFKKKLIRYAQMYHVGFIQILNDEDSGLSFEVYDPFEISIYPNISNINDYPKLVKHVNHRFIDLIGNDLYDQEAVVRLYKEASGNSKYSDSMFKDAIMTSRYGKGPDDGVIIDEFYQIVKVKVNQKGDVVEESDANDPEEYIEKVNAGEETNVDQDEEEEVIEEQERVQIKAYIGEELVRDEITNLRRLPFSMFCWGDEAYATSFLEDLMPMNRSYDIFISKLEHKAKKMDTGRYAIQAKENTKLITTNDGEFIRYKRLAPKVMEEAGVPSAFLQMVERLESDMKEQGVALTSAEGLPAGVEAWRAIESIKEIDYGSIGEQQENLDECLTDIAEKVTEMLAYDMTDIQNDVIENEVSGDFEPVKVIGKRGAELIMSENIQDAIIINPERKTKVQVESEMTWTEAGKRELTFDAFREGLIPPEMAIEALRLGNGRDIAEQLLLNSTKGKSLIDMPDFQLLPPELQQAIAKYLAQGGTVTDGGSITNNE